jgi:hypothetical protein
MVVSVGTGKAANLRPDLDAGDLWLLDHAKNIPAALMNAASEGWDMACRTIGECRFGAAVDREFGDMVFAPGTGHGRLFSYVRYDPEVTRAGLDALGLAGIESDHVRLMDSTEHIADIQRVGVAYGERHVDVERHFTGFID